MWASKRRAGDPARVRGPHCQPGTWWEGRRRLHATVRADMESSVSASLISRCRWRWRLARRRSRAHVWYGHGVAPPEGPMGRHSCASRLPAQPGAPLGDPRDSPPACCPGPADPFRAVNRPTGAREAADLPWGESRGFSAPEVAQGDTSPGDSAPGGRRVDDEE